MILVRRNVGFQSRGLGDGDVIVRHKIKRVHHNVRNIHVENTGSFAAHDRSTSRRHLNLETDLNMIGHHLRA